MKRESQMSWEEIQDVLENTVNWTQVHKDQVFGDYGASVVIYTDGSTSIQDQSTYYPDPDAAGVLAYVRCSGFGNIDRTDYLEGWTKPELDEDGIETGNVVIAWGFKDSENGTVLNKAQAVEKAIEEGSWDEYEYIDDIGRQIEERRELRNIE